MEEPIPLHPALDFSKHLTHDHPGKLLLWGCFSKIGFIRGLNERYFLVSLKQFLTGPDGKKVTHFNFEKNFDSFATNSEKNFDLFIDMLAENNSITHLEIGNNYMPINLMTKLAKMLVGKTILVELNVRMHWPGFMQSQHNLPFIICLAKELPRNLGLEKLDLSGNHINKEGLTALTVACEKLEYLLEVNLTDVTYMDMTPREVYDSWLRIHHALEQHKNLYDAIISMPSQPSPELPKPKKRQLIVSSDDEQETFSPQLVKYPDKHSFFKQHVQPKAATIPAQTTSFTKRLAAIGIDITTDTTLGVRSIELIYDEQIGDKCYRKFMEDPHALFYRHQGHTYQRNYDANFIKQWVKTKRWVPYSQREFKEYFIAPNPFKKREIDKFIQGLEFDYKEINWPRLYKFL